MYLRELRLAQMERIMAEFIYGVDIYLSVVRDAKEVNPKVSRALMLQTQERCFWKLFNHIWTA